MRSTLAILEYLNFKGYFFVAFLDQRSGQYFDLVPFQSILARLDTLKLRSENGHSMASRIFPVKSKEQLVHGSEVLACKNELDEFFALSVVIIKRKGQLPIFFILASFV